VNISMALLTQREEIVKAVSATLTDRADVMGVKFAATVSGHMVVAVLTLPVVAVEKCDPAFVPVGRIF